MLLTSKNLRKLKRLRRRAWMVGMVLGFSGCAYWGGQLAFAHTRPVPVLPNPSQLPAWTACAQPGFSGWLGLQEPGAVWLKLQDTVPAVDPLSDPRLHENEQACNDSGTFGGGDEFELNGEGWNYSSLEGLSGQTQPTPQTGPPDPEQLRPLGWDGQVPVWALWSPRGLAELMPDGLRPGVPLQAVEARLWPQQSRGQISVVLDHPLELPKSDWKLEEAWKQLPSARFMFCMRKEVLSALCQASGDGWRNSLVRRLLLPSEHWVGCALEQELSPQAVRENWSRVHQGWLPVGLWGDYSAQVGGAQNIALCSTDRGSLFTLGLPAQPGTSTGPWENWSKPDSGGEEHHWLGAGRLDWRSAPTELRRIEWAAEAEQSRIVFHIHWSAPVAAEENEVATMSPDVETIYTPRPNVIAGQ